MKILLRCLFLLSWLNSFGQQTPYQPFEVDSAAEPRGGIAYLNTFIEANLRKPIAAEAAGIGGRIILSAVIEPDGSLSDVKPMNSLRPDCDREALRVIKLFNAWKPAQKAGKAVRQQITTSVIFKRNQTFTYWKGAIITYLDVNKQSIPDATNQGMFKQVMPVDTNGLPAGDLVLYKLNGKDWDEHYRDPFVRKKTSRVSSSGQPIYMLGYQSALQDGQGYVYTVDKAGNLLEKVAYKDSRPLGTHIRYHDNGVVAEKQEHTGDRLVLISWYNTGQIKQVQEMAPPSPSSSLISDQVTGLWDSTGRQLVKEGNGWAVFTKPVTSKSSPAQQTFYTEQGAYENSVKQGKWTGQYADKSYFYEEHYNKGIFQSGKSWTVGADTVQYSQLAQQPKFEGGMSGLQEFLVKNLSYPVNAQKSSAQGKVFVSFVVCEDGSLCDYEIIKSVHPDLDREALRVVQKMSGRWTPGIQRGQKSRVKYNMPINFSLQ